MKKAFSITEGLIITEIITLFFVPYTYPLKTPVDSCPANEHLWVQKSRGFPCEDPGEVYHCIRSQDHGLMETCMRAYTVNSDKDGCPWVKIHDGKAYLGNPFDRCDPFHSGCPGNPHKKYSTDELYKYPVCIKSGTIPTIISPANSSATTTTKETGAVEGRIYKIRYVVLFLIFTITIIPVLFASFGKVPLKYELRFEGMSTTGNIADTTSQTRIARFCIPFCKFALLSSLYNSTIHNELFVLSTTLCLKQLGFTESETAVIYGIIIFSRFISSQIVGRISIRTRKPKFMLIVCSILSAAFYNLLWKLLSNSPSERKKINTTGMNTKLGLNSDLFWVLFVILVFVNIASAPVISLCDTVAYDTLREKTVGYSRWLRLWSAILILIWYIMPWFFNIKNFPMMLCFSCSSLFFIASLFSLCFRVSEDVYCGVMVKLKQQYVFHSQVTIFLCVVLLFGFYSGGIEAFRFWFLEKELGNYPYVIPVLCVFIIYVSEISLMPCSAFVIKKTGHLIFLYTTFIAYALRFFSYSILVNPWIVLPVEVIHGVTNGLFLEIATSYARIITPPDLSSTVNVAITGLYFGLGKGIGSLVTGLFCNLLGFPWLFRVYGIIALSMLGLYFIINNKVFKGKAPYGKHDCSTTEDELEGTEKKKNSKY